MERPDRTIKQQRNAKRESRRQREEAAQQRQKRRTWLWWGVGGLIGVAVVAALIFGNSANNAQATPTIDGVQCNANEGTVLHIHQHLTILDKGKSIGIPSGVGINQTQGCLYWLHTHRPDGVIHVESPTQTTYTLGQFFAVWGQPLSTTRAASAVATGSDRLRAYVNGRVYRGDPRTISLAAHERITLEVGPPWVTPPSWTFQAGE